MTLEHVVIWTNQIEKLKDYYEAHFGGIANDKYVNASKGLVSYFITFEVGARLELMSMPGVPGNLNDVIDSQHLGLIHMAFGVSSVE